MSESSQASDDKYRGWVTVYLKPKYPELVKPFLEALRLYEAAKKRGAVTQQALEKLLERAGSSRTPLGENVAAMLGDLYEVDDSAGAAIRALATGRTLHERINALVALDSCHTTELHAELLPSLLADRSGRVRALAADKIVGHGMLELLEKLKLAHQNESSSGVKEELGADIEYLEQGKHVRWSGRRT